MASHDRPTPPGSFTLADGLMIHHQQRGTGGPGLLMLHGYLASTTIWNSVMDTLGQTCRTVAVDLPGAGYSDRPSDAPYDPDWLAQKVKAISDSLDMDRPILAAHSLGGAVAIRALSRYPHMARGLVLISPLVYSPPPPPGLRLAKKYPGPAGLFFKSPLGRALVAKLVRRAVYNPEEGQAKARRRAQRMLAHLDAPGGWSAATRTGLSASDGAPGRTELAAIKVPTLVFWGGRDRAHPASIAPRLMDDLGGRSHLVLFPQAAHNCHEDESQQFCQELVNWAKREELL